jgi:hypothetical protein
MSADAKPSPDVNQILDPVQGPGSSDGARQRGSEGGARLPAQDPQGGRQASRSPPTPCRCGGAPAIPTTPTAAKGMMMAALAYFVLPTDAIPDVLPAIGFTDDAAVIAAVIAIVGKNLKPRHKESRPGLPGQTLRR